MAWFKVDDQLAFHSKTMLAGNEAMGLWVRAGSWSSAHFTNGFIPEHMALAMAPPLAKEGLPSVAIDLPSRLIDAGFWHKVEGGYQFHDWDDFQPDGKAEKEKREETRKARSEAGKKGAAARWGHEIDDSKGDAEPLANAMAKDGKANGKPMAPSRPVPSNREGRSSRKSRIPEDWEPSDSHKKRATEKNLDLNEEAEKFKNWAIANDRKYVDWGRAFSNWLINARPKPQETFDPWKM